MHEEIPRAGSAGYDAAKGGLRNLTRTLCLELAPDRINVNNLAPGMALTPMNQAALDDPKVREKQVQSIPWKRAADHGSSRASRSISLPTRPTTSPGRAL